MDTIATLMKAALATRAVPKKHVKWTDAQWYSVARMYSLYIKDAGGVEGEEAKRRYALTLAQQSLPDDRRRPLKGTGQVYDIVHKLEKILAANPPAPQAPAPSQEPLVPANSLRGLVVAAAKASNTGLAGLVEQVAAHKVIQPSPVLPMTPPPVAPISGILRTVVKEEITAQDLRAGADLRAMEERIMAAISASERRMMAVWLGDAPARASVVSSDVVTSAADVLPDLGFTPIKTAAPRPKRVLIVGAMPRQAPYYKKRLPGVEIVVTKEVKAYGHFDLVVGLSKFLSKPMRKAMHETFGNQGFVEASGVVTKVCEVISAKL